jgi:hypothetical protein
MLLVWVVVRLTEEYPVASLSSIAPEAVQPGAYSGSFKAQIFSKLDVRDPILPTSPCPFVYPGHRHVENPCRLCNRHQILIPFIDCHTYPHVAQICLLFTNIAAKMLPERAAQ